MTEILVDNKLDAVAISTEHLVQDYSSWTLCPELLAWLREHGISDGLEDCQWWMKDVDDNPVGLVWIRDLEVRLLFKLTWGGK